MMENPIKTALSSDPVFDNQYDIQILKKRLSLYRLIVQKYLSFLELMTPLQGQQRMLPIPLYKLMASQLVNYC